MCTLTRPVATHTHDLHGFTHQKQTKISQNGQELSELWSKHSWFMVLIITHSILNCVLYHPSSGQVSLTFGQDPSHLDDDVTPYMWHNLLGSTTQHHLLLSELTCSGVTSLDHFYMISYCQKWVHCTTNYLGAQVQRISDVSFSSYAVPAYY